MSADTKRLEGVKAIEGERLRQIEVEGWSLEHDETHSCGELVQAALCYITRNQIKWPWLDSKPKFSSHTIRNLTIAGALIAAEIDRLLAIDAAMPQTKEKE